MSKETVSNIDVFRSTVHRLAPEFKMALPPQINVERFIRTTITAVQMTPALLDADRRTLLAACMKSAQDGLLPDGREAAFVLFGKKGSEIKTVQYMPMIGGLFKKARNSGEISSITTHVVYERDFFKYILGDDEKIEHTPVIGADRGEPVAAYAIAKTKDGATYREVMSVADINKVRNVSRAKDDGPWRDWWDEMARKTVFRRLAKRLPSSADLESTLEADDAVIGYQPAAPGPSLLDPPADRAPRRTQTIVADAMREPASAQGEPGPLVGDPPAEGAGDQPGPRVGDPPVDAAPGAT